MRRRITFTACLLLAFALFSPCAAADRNPPWREAARSEAERDGYGLIDDRSLNKRIRDRENIVILDARADYEFAAGHIPGAVNLEFDLGDRMDLPADKRNALRAVLGPDTSRTVVVYCRSFR